MGKQSLVLIPEIGLTQQITGLFEERLGPRVCVLHSRLSDNQRALEWFRIKSGEADVVVGARSAVFAPFERLGLIIMDEEQENSFSSEEMPRYSTRTVANRRAQTNGAVLIMGSATPSIESYYMAERGVYTLLQLPEKVAPSGKRSVELVDMKDELRQGNRSIISGILLNGLKDCLSAGEQAIIFLNRRGYSTTAICQECGNIISCRSCDVAMTYHRDTERMVCHYCGRQKQRDTKCSKCGSSQIRLLGIGTQKVQQELQEILPEARITRMDADSTRGRDGHRKVIDEIKGKKTDIIVGTQMIAKGFDFPNVSLVGVVNADPLMGLPDFRAREKHSSCLPRLQAEPAVGAVPAGPDSDL
jgi:primosomal protein N' (replication factor Y)